jgi:nitrate reductase delta subunit
MMVRHKGTREPTALLCAIGSMLLRYPDEGIRGQLTLIRAALPALANPTPLSRFITWFASQSPTEVAQHYVTTFDHTRRRSLYLTYYRHGDTRARGMALLALKHTYRQAGYPPPEAELPDFLPLILEFAAHEPEAGQRILIHCRAGLELLGDALHDAGTPYVVLLDAIRTSLPTLSRRDRNQLRTLADAGPPTEHVGLEPFAPPDYVTGER